MHPCSTTQPNDLPAGPDLLINPTSLNNATLGTKLATSEPWGEETKSKAELQSLNAWD